MAKLWDGSLLEISSSQLSKLLGRNQVSNRSELRLSTKSEPINWNQNQKTLFFKWQLLIFCIHF